MKQGESSWPYEISYWHYIGRSRGGAPGAADPPPPPANFQTKLRPEWPKNLFLETDPPPPLPHLLI